MEKEMTGREMTDREMTDREISSGGTNMQTKTFHQGIPKL